MVKKTKDPSSTAEKKITTMVKSRNISQNMEAKEMGSRCRGRQDRHSTEKWYSVTGLVITVGGSVCPATET